MKCRAHALYRAKPININLTTKGCEMKGLKRADDQTHQLVGHISVVLSRELLPDGALHQTRQRW
jgi:hypothetical protein